MNKENIIKDVAKLIKSGNLQDYKVEILQQIIKTSGHNLSIDEVQEAKEIAKDLNTKIDNITEFISKKIPDENLEIEDNNFENNQEIYNEEWLSIIPDKCDICEVNINDTFIDGKTGFDLVSPWAIMCNSCHQSKGIGLGIGKGQKYEKKTLLNIKNKKTKLEKWICIEGIK